MTILSTDIKLLASERMTETSDGGGRRTSTVIPDGVPGNIFPKISRLDSVYGRVNLRKIYGAVATANLDTYAGAHAVLMDAPDNNRIHACLFSTASDFDDRTASRDRIESYVTAGPEGRMTLYGRQLLGQSAITVYQRVEDTLPEAGDVYCLSKESGGVTSDQQYVRVTDVTHELRTLEDVTGTFERRIISLKLSATLRYEFNGPDTPSRFSQVSRPTVVRYTNVANAARYYGIQPVAQAAEQNDMTLRVSSVYTPIVPSTSRETPVSSAQIGGAAHMHVTAPEALGWQNTGASVAGSGTTTVTLRAPAGVAPGTLLLRQSYYYAGSVVSSPEASDDGLGNILPVANNTHGFGFAGGTIDYATGSISVICRHAAAADIDLSYLPAVEVSQAAHTRRIPVDLATRGTVYVQTLLPIPAPGTLAVDFRALGRWYRLRDDGAGALSGLDAAYGTGSIDYATGAVVVTLGALPDVDSAVLMAWGSPAHYLIAAGAASDAGSTATVRLQADQLPLVPNTLALSWTDGTTTYTAVDTAGALVGDCTGTVNRVTGQITMEVSAHLPAPGTALTLEYSQGAAVDPLAPTYSAGSTPILLDGLLDLPFAITVSGLAMTVPFGTLQVALADNGAGALVTTAQRLPVTSAPGSWNLIAAGQVVGTVNYATGAIAITAGVNVSFRGWYPADGGWSASESTLEQVAGTCTYTILTGAASNAVNITQEVDLSADAPVSISLTRTLALGIIPGSVMFTFAGRRYIDRSGLLYTDLTPSGSGTSAGTIDYATGVCALTLWTPAAASLAVQSCLCVYGQWIAVEAFFRTAGSPLRPASFYIQATAEDGELLTMTSDDAGAISGAAGRGAVNLVMGSVWVQWGAMVTAAGNEAEEWYDPANVVGPNVWRPRRIIPSSIRYNCVVLTSLPLDADILGLDPVRLPSDGRVPIFRPADVVVIHNTKTYALPNPAVASTTYSVGRTDLSEAWVVDAAGALVATTHYTANLAAGAITMAADLDLGATPQPLAVRHRIEELNLLSDVQINGQIGLTGPLSRDYDADTLVSSALLFGDLFGRVTGVFDQGTWTGTWSDALIGAQATGQYNTVDYPIEVLNNSAVTERWRINFTSGTAFQLIGENLGVIATGSTAADLQVSNALTGLPYFTLRAAGWGAGWAAGNQLRFNTVGATAPIWIARTVLPGATLSGDSIDLQLRGDVDA